MADTNTIVDVTIHGDRVNSVSAYVPKGKYLADLICIEIDGRVNIWVRFAQAVELGRRLQQLALEVPVRD